MLKTEDYQINNPWFIKGEGLKISGSSERSGIGNKSFDWKTFSSNNQEKGLLTEYLEKNTKSIAGIKEGIVEIAKELKKIGFVSLMEKDPLIDNPENLIQEARNQDAELQLIQSHINTVIEFLKVSV